MSRLFSDGGTAARAAIRTGLVLVTALGFKLDAAQVAAIQGFAEAVLALGGVWYRKAI